MSYPIKPSDINVRQIDISHFNTSAAAEALIVLAQAKGDWRDFRAEEIQLRETLDLETEIKLLMLRGADGKVLIRENDDGTYSFTHEFVSKCFASSPATTDLSLWREVALKKT